MLEKTICKLRASARTVTAPSFPDLFYLEITSACNLRCPSCVRTYSKRPRRHMEESIFRKVMEEILAERADIKHIGLHLHGEALLNPRFFDLVEIARTYLPHTTLAVSSNANLLSPQKIEQLLHSQLDSFGIWPDTTNPELYDKVRKGGELKKVEQAIIELLEKRRELGREDIEIHIGAVLYKNNRPTFKEFISRWETICCKYDNVHVFAIESHDWAGQVPADNVLNSVSNSIIHMKKVCFMPFAWCMISSEGFITPCCLDGDLSLSWGNVKTNSIREIWNGPEARALRERQLTGQVSASTLCYNCHMYRPSISSMIRSSSIRKIPLIGRIFKKEYDKYFYRMEETSKKRGSRQS